MNDVWGDDWRGETSGKEANVSIICEELAHLMEDYVRYASNKRIYKGDRSVDQSIKR